MMTGKELKELLSNSYRRSHLTGTLENGVIAALDMEGRLFTIVNNRVINRVVPSAIINRSNKNTYQNPGGDTLWPAPEGTTLGYEYATGSWRVPPSITGAVWEVVEEKPGRTVIRAEIDLVNNRQVGIPCEFERAVEIKLIDNGLIQTTTEIIRYLGSKKLLKGEFLLAPWSLCQFDSDHQGKVIMPLPDDGDIWDFYESSENQMQLADGLLVVHTKTDKRFQLGLSQNISWIEYVLEGRYRVKRYSDDLPQGHRYIDIADAPPGQQPSEMGVKLSVYCDPSGFMEIEASGGCTKNLEPGTELCLKVITEYRLS